MDALPRMWRTIAASTLVWCMFTTPAKTAIIEIPLPALLGDYPGGLPDASRTVAFQLPGIPTVIHGVSFRIIGTSIIGLANCRQAGTADLWPMEFVAEMKFSDDDYWQAVEEPAYNAFEFTRTAEFEAITETATWDFLLDGEGEVTLIGRPLTALTVCDPIILPTGHLTEAVLIVDAEFQLAIEASTWGKIKALYRK